MAVLLPNFLLNIAHSYGRVLSTGPRSTVYPKVMVATKSSPDCTEIVYLFRLLRDKCFFFLRSWKRTWLITRPRPARLEGCDENRGRKGAFLFIMNGQLVFSSLVWIHALTKGSGKSSLKKHLIREPNNDCIVCTYVRINEFLHAVGDSIWEKIGFLFDLPECKKWKDNFETNK